MSMHDITAEILQLSKLHFDDIVSIRRDIHQHPETGFAVHRTAAIAARELKSLGISVKTDIGKTGVVGDIEIPEAKKRIALRADMDALPLQELGNRPYKSKFVDKAHMCGHDLHTAMLIGAARIISTMRERLKCSVRFVFQPCEERYPGGAQAMIEDGVLDGVDEIYALHVWPLLTTGRIAVCAGTVLGQGDSFTVEITGRGGHGSAPHLSIDPILIACQFITNVQSIVSRNVDPLDAAVISATQIHGGTAFNVIPASVEITGTVRTLKKTVQTTVRKRMEEVLAGITAANGASYAFSYNEGYPVTSNQAPCVKRAVAAAENLVSDNDLIYPYPPNLGSEDFGFYTRKVPGCFIFLGAGNRQCGMEHMCHDPRFDADEQCMVTGMAMHATLALGLDSE